MVLALHAEPLRRRSAAVRERGAAARRHAAAVPRILDHADDLGLLALQDLGDVTLQAHLGAAPARRARRLYRQAVSLIETLQRRGAELASPAYPPYGIAFDVEKLLWELEFFTKHFLEAYRGAAIPPPTRTALRGEWRVAGARNLPPSRGCSATATITAAT